MSNDESRFMHHMATSTDYVASNPLGEDDDVKTRILFHALMCYFAELGVDWDERDKIISEWVAVIVDVSHASWGRGWDRGYEAGFSIGKRAGDAGGRNAG